LTHILIYRKCNIAYSVEIRAARVEAVVDSMIDRAIAAALYPIWEELRAKREMTMAPGAYLDTFTVLVEV